MFPFIIKSTSKQMKNEARDRADIVAFVTGNRDLGGSECSPERQKRIEELFLRVQSGEPLAYVLGRVDFFGCTIFLSRDTLIPRPESEILVEKALKEIKGSGRLLDLCAGSGCLGLAIKKMRPALQVHLSDLSAGCVKMCQKNAAYNGLDVILHSGNLLDPFLEETFDYVICNPPYVTDGEYEVLEESVKKYEPKMALVGGEDGLSFYRELSGKLAKFLTPGGKVFFEIGYNQGDEVMNLFGRTPWTDARVEKDWSGHDRFFFAVKKETEKNSLGG